MQSGVYRKIEGKTGTGQLYLFIALAHMHEDRGSDAQQYVIYIPLYTMPEWALTLRHCILERELFERKFEWAGETLP